MGRKFIERWGECLHCKAAIKRDGRARVKKFCNTACWYDFKCPIGTRIPAEKSKPNGYFIVKVPIGTPGSRISGNRGHWMLEHRYVMQQKLGRALRKGENVHHINGVRDDNRPENLELWQKAQCVGVRVSDIERVNPFFEGVRAW